MITSITIDGLRGIRHGEVAGLGGLSILVGPNGCGKSTVLDALLIGASPWPARAVCRVVRRRAEVVVGQSPILSPAWLAHHGRSRAAIAIRVGGIATFTGTLVQVKQAGADILTEGTLTARFPGHGVHWDRASCRVTTEDLREGAPETTLIDPIEDPIAPLHSVYSDAARRGRVTFANEVLSDLIPRFARLEILTEAGNPVLYMHLGDTPVPVALAGEGVLALVRTVLELAACDQGGMALLEEPEVHQHPRSLRLMAQGICAAVKRDVQVILTTHSLELIESLLHAAAESQTLDRTSMHLVRLRDGELSATRVAGEVAKFQIVEIGEDLR